MRSRAGSPKIRSWRIALSQRSLLASPPLDKGNEDSGNEIETTHALFRISLLRRQLLDKGTSERLVQRTKRWLSRVGPSSRSFAPFLPQTPETQELPAEEANSTCGFPGFVVIPQRDAFHHISKHREENWKYDAQRSIFDEIRGFWKCDETLSRVFDISSQSKLKLRRKQRNKINRNC